ncbi:MAG: TraR/DksA C4-type zinc finger protein [Patescibacteria group bacterium]|nr:TraR/DksA C4-type zinc finger protein [Patescibacteria group bacterium]
MDEKLLQFLKKRLEKQKKILEEELGSFAKKDKKLKNNWKSRFPKFDRGLDSDADKVEEYSTRLPIEYSLETKLKDISIALQKIKNNKYGKCEKCKKPISEKRLKTLPEARFCIKCEHSNSQEK